MNIENCNKNDNHNNIDTQNNNDKNDANNGDNNGNKDAHNKPQICQPPNPQTTSTHNEKT